MKGLLIRPDSTVETLDNLEQLANMQEAVGDYIEVVGVGSKFNMIVNGNGIAEGLTFNPVVSAIMSMDRVKKYGEMAHGFILGPAIVVGPCNGDGDFESVTDEVQECIVEAIHRVKKILS